MEPDIVKKTIEWVISAMDAIEEAHGNPRYVLSMMPINLLECLIRNDIKLKYNPVDNNL